MADNIALSAAIGSGETIKTDDDGTAHWQYVKLAFGADNTQTIVGSISSNPLPVALSATDNAVLGNIQTSVQLLDNAISGAGYNITQLNGAAVPVGAGVEATALRVTIATDSTGVLSIDDNGGSITVDGTVSVNSHAVTNAGTFATQVDGAALTALQLIDDPVATLGTTTYTEATTKGVTIGAVRNDDLATLAGTDNEIGPLQMTQNGALLMCPAANDDYKYAKIDHAVSGNNEIVALVASRKIRVLAVFMVANGTVAARFESNAGGTALTGQMNLVVNSGFVLPFNPAGWFESVSGQNINLELSAAISVDGSLTYIEVA